MSKKGSTNIDVFWYKKLGVALFRKKVCLFARFSHFAYSERRIGEPVPHQIYELFIPFFDARSFYSSCARLCGFTRDVSPVSIALNCNDPNFLNRELNVNDNFFSVTPTVLRC